MVAPKDSGRAVTAGPDKSILTPGNSRDFAGLEECGARTEGGPLFLIVDESEFRKRDHERF